jgi:hypothetical protein
MLDRPIKRFEKTGKIRKQRAGIVKIEALLKEAIPDLEEAKRVVNLAERATYLLAYNAVLKAGRAFILSQGYVPEEGA